jgi:uncharacterized repeat protein (TIGR04052 family)
VHAIPPARKSRPKSERLQPELRAPILAALCLAALTASCGQPDLGVTIPFVATWHGNPLDCRGTSPALTDLRFYVSNPRLIDADGHASDLSFASEVSWQNDAVALIDLENGEGECMNGTAEVFPDIVGVVRAGEYRGLRFTIGVPFLLNHANPLVAEPPLDDPDMHWHWRSGYKFLRAGVRTEMDSFWIHAGSAGCDGTVGHITGCRFPNRVDVYLPDFEPGDSVVRIELTELLAGTDMDDGVATDCSSGPPETSCLAPFAALGIDFPTGENLGSQSVFQVQ